MLVRSLGALGFDRDYASFRVRNNYSRCFVSGHCSAAISSHPGTRWIASLSKTMAHCQGQASSAGAVAAEVATIAAMTATTITNNTMRLTISCTTSLLVVPAIPLVDCSVYR